MTERVATDAGAWLKPGTVPSGWASTTVGEIATLTDGPFGSNLKTSHYVESGPRVVRLQNIGDGVFRDERAHITVEHFQRLAKHEVVAGDVVAASLGDDPPRACLVPSWLGPAIVKADCIRIRAAEGVEPALLMWMLNSRPVRAQAALRVKGIGRPRLGLGGIRQLGVHVPPLNEQRRIVAAIEEHLSRLDAADASLNHAMRQCSALERVAIANALAGDWKTVTLKDVSASQVYGTSAKANGDASGVPVLRMGNIQRGRLDLGDLKYLPPEHPDVPKLVLESGDLLFNRTNSAELVGKSAVFTASERMTFASYLIRVRLNERCDPHWAALVINGPPGRNYIASVRTQQVGQANVNGSKLAAMPIPLPPLEEQRRIVAEIKERLGAIDALRAAIERARRRGAALRRSVLERAFRGELVAQDPSDEPASVLLDRIRAERAVVAAPARRRKTATSRPAS